jgi:hypothetical protein
MKKLILILIVLISSCQDIIVEPETKEVKTLEVNIGQWDMLTNDNHVVIITEDFYPEEILIFEAWIINDNNSSLTNLISYNVTISDYNGNVVTYNLNEVVLSRRRDSQYRSMEYSNTEINRGVLIIKYR